MPDDPEAKVVTWWSVAEDEAEILRMKIPEYLDWVVTEQGRWWLERLRIKWRIKAEADRQEAEAREEEQEDQWYRRAGWRGGHTDPEGQAVDV